jgi:tetratricopeptide (TPR) repeat protein
MANMNFVAAKCPQCAGSLQVPDDREIVKCMYCGVDVVVRQAIQLVSGNAKNFLQLAKNASAAGNYSEAHGYYTKVLEVEPQNAEAWFGKGTSAGWQSNLKGFRFREMLIAYDNAINCSQANSVGKMRLACARLLNEVANACCSMSQKHAAEFITVPNVWGEHMHRSLEIISVYEAAHRYAPHERAIMKNIIAVCVDLIQGVKYEELVPGTSYKGSKVVHLSDEYEQTMRGTITAYARKIQELDPNYVEPNPQRPTAGWCFVVTATLGSDHHPQVLFLRSFRDEVLLRSACGAAFVAWYYKNGPRAARRIENSKFARALSYLFLVLPMVAAARIVTWAANPKATRARH